MKLELRNKKKNPPKSPNSWRLGDLARLCSEVLVMVTLFFFFPLNENPQVVARANFGAHDKAAAI